MSAALVRFRATEALSTSQFRVIRELGFPTWSVAAEDCGEDEMPVAHQEQREVGLAQDNLEALETQAYKRLPGLWMLCVLLGSLGVLCLLMTFFAGPLQGKVISGSAALIVCGLALGLWIRFNVARVAAMGLLALWFVSIAIQWALAGSQGGAVRGAIIRISIALAFFVYLGLRGKYFVTTARQKPMPLGAWGLLAIGAMLLVAGGSMLVANKWYSAYLDGFYALDSGAYERRQAGFLGVVMHDVAAEPQDYLGDGELGGVLVDNIVKGSPAERAGLQAGDVITVYGGKPLDNPETLLRLVDGTAPHTQVMITFVRAGREQSATVTIGTRVIDLHAPAGIGHGAVHRE